MINIYSDSEIEKIKKAGVINKECHEYLASLIKPGISTKYLDDMAGEFITSHGGVPASKGYEGYPNNICISLNDEIVHGIGKDDVLLKEGDIISFDIMTKLDGYIADSATTWPVGKVNKEKEHLMYHTKKALYVGLKELKAGVPIGNCSARIQQYAEKHGLSVPREIGGHGVGRDVHEDPFIPNYGKYGEGLILKKGQVIAIEPMLAAGKRYVDVLDDDWTIVTRDGSPSAHFEHTVVITDDGYEILTGE